MFPRFLSTVGATALSLLALAACSDRVLAPDSIDPRDTAAGVNANATVGDASATGALTSKLSAALCAAVDKSSQPAGRSAVMAVCSGDALQQFRLDSSTRTISASNGSLCLDVVSGHTTDGTPVITWSCHGQANQQWTRTAGQLIGIGGKCLAVLGAKTTPGATLVITTCDGSASQQWAFGSDRRLAVPGAPTAAAATPGNAQADVTWNAPERGGAPASYTVVAAPGGATSSVSAPALRATVAGLTNGVAYRFTVVASNATGAGPASTPSAPVTPIAPPTVGNWTFCTAAGAMCDFVGLRDVRLGGPNGPFVQQTSYANVPCAAYGFDGKGPAVPNGTPQHCDYGPMKTTVLTNPMPGMAGLAAQVTVPLGDPGSTGPRVQGGAGAPVYVEGTGSFRTTCGFVKYAFDDPMVYPGQAGASHLHVFFGNVATNASSTPATLVANGNSSCLGGTLNRTGYWAPAVFDAATQQVQAPARGVFYYKTGYNFDVKTIQPMPAGLRMMAGDKTATGPQPNAYWECRDHYTPQSATIPTTCPVGDAVRLTINFPQCWDGVRLDAPDHKSHMAFAINRNPPQKSTCPADHPVPLIAMAEHVDYPVTAGSHPERWRLVSDMYAQTQPGGLSAHADWMNGWDAATMRKFVTYCLNRSMDCGVGGLGDGTALY